MPPKPQASTRSRLTLDLSAQLTANLNAYAEKHGMAKADVLRSAIDMLMAADDAAASGLKVGAWGMQGDKQIEREFIGLR